MIGTTMALIGMGIAAASSGASAAIGANAAGNAADAQASAAKYAADKQAQSAADSLNFQKEQYANTQTLEQPYIAAGDKALGQLSDGTQPGGDLVPGSLPADQVLANDPGYQFRMDQGQQALERSASATGGLGSGGTLKAISRYGQDYASGEYANANQRFVNNQTQRFNQLAALSGVGQTATSGVAQAGQSAANNIANINTTTATQQGNDAMAAANATASGYIGSANAVSSGLSGLTNNATNLLLLSKLGKP